MTASPMNLSTVPPWRWMTPVISVKHSFISSTISRGARPSESDVKPATSANITVSSRVSPPRASWPGFFTSWSTTSGAT